LLTIWTDVAREGTADGTVRFVDAHAKIRKTASCELLPAQVAELAIPVSSIARSSTQR